MWNADRGFGFIKDDAGGPDMFLHINELKSAGIDPDSIKIGDQLTFETTSTRDGKTKASNVRTAKYPFGRVELKAKKWANEISSIRRRNCRTIP
jgi:CspA family cold shock protein